MFKFKTLLFLVIIFGIKVQSFTQSFTHTFVANSNGCNWPYSSVAYNSSNEVYNFWKFDNTYKLIKWNGASWVDIGSFLSTDVIANYSSSDDVSLAIDANNHFHVTFRLIQNAGCCSQRRGVWYGKSTNGTTWTFAEIEAYTDPNGWKNADDPLVRVDGSNNPHIAFLYSDVNGNRIHSVRYFKYNGSSWSGVDAFSQTGPSNEVDDLGFDLDASGFAHISFLREMNGSGLDGGLWYVNNTSGSFPAPTELIHGDTGLDYGNGSNLQVDNSGKIHIFSYDYQDHLTHSTNASGSWVHTWINGDVIATIGRHSFHLNGNGDKFVVFKTTSPNFLKSAYQKTGETCWLIDTLFSGTGSFGGPPYAGTMTNSRLLAVMTDSIIGSCSGSHPRKLYSITSDFSSQTCSGGCTPPSFTACPSSISMNTSSGICSKTHSYTATATGDPVPTLSYAFTGATTGSGSGTGSGSSFNKGVTTVTITATNGCSPNATCVFTITVNDNEMPTINNCPSNLSYNTAPGTCNATATWTAPTASDNCPGVSISSTHSPGSSFNKGVTTVIYTATDMSGNTKTCSFTVTVTDNEMPMINNCPSNISVNTAPGVCNAVATWTAPTTTDNCPGGSISSTHNSGSSFNKGVTTVIYTATDMSGNTKTCSFTVTVTDNEMPVINNCPSNISLNTSTGTCSATASWTAPTASDNCPGVSISSTHNSGTSFNKGVTTVTYTATDMSGNTKTCSFTVTVTDNEMPVINNCPSNISVNTAPGMCSATATWTAPTATDNCPGVSISSTHSSGSSFNKGVTTVTYTATDMSGNTKTCSFTVTVNDNEMPMINNCPGNISLNTSPGTCSATASWTAPTATDNCPGVMLSSTHSSGSSFGTGTHTVLYTATDMSGNTKTCSFTITVTDNEMPGISCPGNAMRNNSPGVCKYNVSGAEFNATATDNCGIMSNNYTLSGATMGTGSNLNGVMLNKGITTVMWKATDNSGNMKTCSFTVEVKDNEAPMLTCPADKTVTTAVNQCTAAVALGTPTTSDNCDVPSTSNNGLAQYPLGVTMVMWTSTDLSGNSKTCTQKVTVNAATCGIPTQVFHYDTFATTAKVKWKPGKCAVVHELRIRREISPGVWGAYSAWAPESGPGYEHLFTGLIPGSFYHYQLRTNCFSKVSASINGWFHTLSSFTEITERSEEIPNNEFSLPAHIAMVPNPARDFSNVLIQGFETAEKEIVMMDLYGKLVFRVSLRPEDNNLELDLHTLNVHTGVYLIRVSNGQRQKTEQLMIER